MQTSRLIKSGRISLNRGFSARPTATLIFIGPRGRAAIAGLTENQRAATWVKRSRMDLADVDLGDKDRKDPQREPYAEQVGLFVAPTNSREHEGDECNDQQDCAQSHVSSLGTRGRFQRICSRIKRNRVRGRQIWNRSATLRIACIRRASIRCHNTVSNNRRESPLPATMPYLPIRPFRHV